MKAKFRYERTTFPQISGDGSAYVTTLGGHAKLGIRVANDGAGRPLVRPNSLPSSVHASNPCTNDGGGWRWSSGDQVRCVRLQMAGTRLSGPSLAACSCYPVLLWSMHAGLLRKDGTHLLMKSHQPGEGSCTRYLCFR